VAVEPSEQVDPGDLRIDGARLWSRLEALGEIGAVIGPKGERGVARLALSDEDQAGRDLVVTWMRDLGMDVAIDGIGNVIATLVGPDAGASPVMVGSHIDTVRTGGRFDGNLGVLAGLEVVETIVASGMRPARSIQVAFFTDEEGARFPPDMLGSLVYVGGLAVEDALDARAADGARLGDELIRIGYAGPTPCPSAAFPHCYVELHIEQGPVLEDEGITIGVVTGVQGISWSEFTVTGQSAHAGTTPMRLRKDPLVVAALITAEARFVAKRVGGAQVATVGRIDAFPNLTNVVAQQVRFTLDVRNTDDETLREVETELFAFAARVALEEGCAIERVELARFEPVEFAPEMIDLVERVAIDLGCTTRRMPSGAGHDAQMLARVCPTGMIFVPSVNGLSHNLAEFTTPEDIEAGANVLLHVVLARAALAPEHRA
jgi:beta-ureidopropionase / N-carbamoyl-L-amino-acid hydrolase